MYSTAFNRFVTDETHESVGYRSRAARPAQPAPAAQAAWDGALLASPPPLGASSSVCATPGTPAPTEAKGKAKAKKTTKKKKLTAAQLRAAVREGTLEDVRFLRGGVRSAESGRDVLGDGVTVTLPREWSSDDALRVLRWVESLGFAALSGRRLRIDSKGAAKLARELALAERAMESARKGEEARRRKGLREEDVESVRRVLLPADGPATPPRPPAAPQQQKKFDSIEALNAMIIGFDELRIERMSPAAHERRQRKVRQKAQKLRRVSVARPRLSSVSRRRSSMAPSRLSVLGRRQSVAIVEEPQAKFDPTDHVLDTVLSFLSTPELLQTVPAVSQTWARLSASRASLQTAHAVASNELLLTCWEAFLTEFPSAKFLSDGGFKRVYRVWSRTLRQQLAISVMDYATIAELGDEAIVRAEIDVSFLVSSLVSARVVPNFVNCQRVFHLAYAPPRALWETGSGAEPSTTQPRIPRAPKRQGSFIYTIMELCAGDAEHIMKGLPEQCLPTAWLPSFIFQMAMALYASRERFSMRHYDVKALNFLLSTAEQPPAYALGPHTYAFPEAAPYVVKLADFGTADTDEATLGAPVAVAQFTTLENTPGEFLWLGDAAVQSYAADTFALGLTVFHLFTGEAPYEEIMEDVVCPPGLRAAIAAVWTKHADFSVVRAVLEDDDEGVLYDTLYRVMVLAGAIPEAGHPKLLAAVRKTLLPGTRKRSKAAIAAGRTFDADRELFSLREGTHPALERARARMGELPGALELLEAMLDIDPSNRPTMAGMMGGEFFSGYRTASGGEGVYAHYGGPADEVVDV